MLSATKKSQEDFRQNKQVKVIVIWNLISKEYNILI